ncbi:MAG: HNH endonuclease [Aquamicrobium sp.]|nr:HNH endonuclease [Aquamicrobium sp.]
MDKLDPAARYGVWMSRDGRCTWCGRPVQFQDCQVDHIVPKSVGCQQSRFAEIKEKYGLDQAFEVESFENWAPICARCNLVKSDRTFTDAPIIVSHLTMARILAGLARDNAEKIREDKYKSKVFSRIENAVFHGDVTIEEIKEFLVGLAAISRRSSNFEYPELELAPGWFFRTDGIFAEVRDQITGLKGSIMILKPQ